MIKPFHRTTRQTAEQPRDSDALGLGLDVGMTYFGAAVCRYSGIGSDLRVDLIESNMQGASYRTPSKLLYPAGGGDPIVGAAALSMVIAGAVEELFQLFKRSVGRMLFPSFDPHPPYQLTADLIRAELGDIERYLTRSHLQGRPRKYAFSHPSSWTDLQLRDFRKAIKAAGLRADNLIAEPLAAALGAAFAGQSVADALHGEHTVLVCDIGGGTTDLALIAFSATGGLEMKDQTRGNAQLGMSNLDQLIGLTIYEKTHRNLTDRVVRDAIAQATVSGEPLDSAWRSLPLTPALKAHLLSIADTIKRQICNDMANNLPHLAWPGVWAGVPYTLTREDVAPFIESMRSELRSSIEQYLTKVKRVHIDRVLVTGGGVNLPRIRALFPALLPNANDLEVIEVGAGEAMYLVQRGTAIYACNPSVLKARIANASYGLRGYEVVKATNPLPPGAVPMPAERGEGMMRVLVDNIFIHAGDPLRKELLEEKFSVPQGTTDIEFEIIERLDDDSDSASRVISNMQYHLPAPARAGNEYRFRFYIGSDGSVHVDILNPRTNQWDAMLELEFKPKADR